MNKQGGFLAIGGIFALSAVILGAFGAHALEARLVALDTVDTWETAVDYQMWHALALLIIVALRLPGRAIRVALSCFCLGILLFSGSLYWLALDGPRWLGPITPLGGLLLIIGWGAFFFSFPSQTVSFAHFRDFRSSERRFLSKAETSLARVRYNFVQKTKIKFALCKKLHRVGGLCQIHSIP